MSSSAEAGGMSAGLFPARASGREEALPPRARLRDTAARVERVHRGRRRPTLPGPATTTEE